MIITIINIGTIIIIIIGCIIAFLILRKIWEVAMALAGLIVLYLLVGWVAKIILQDDYGIMDAKEELSNLWENVLSKTFSDTFDGWMLLLKELGAGDLVETLRGFTSEDIIEFFKSLRWW